MPSHSKYLNFNSVFGVFYPLYWVKILEAITLAVSISTPVFYKICWHLCISMPRRRTQHAHDHDLWLFFGLLFLESFDLSQLKKPPLAFNSNSTGKWSLTPRACRTTAQRVGSHPRSLQALPGCSVLDVGRWHVSIASFGSGGHQ